jgi:hypothetical protein
MRTPPSNTAPRGGTEAARGLSETRQNCPLPNSNVPKMFPFLVLANLSTGRKGAFALIGRGGDDGTRTHDPLLANTPEPDGDER